MIRAFRLVRRKQEEAMGKPLLIGVVGVCLAAAASGAEIHGTLSQNGKPVSKDTALRLECGQVSATAQTDEHGSYSLRVATTGECRLSLSYGGSNLTLPVTVYDKPSKYDLVLVEEGGKVVLRRK
jgi:hypothetical protein